MSFFLDSTIDIDPQSDDSQSGAQGSDEEVPFNVAEFNSVVIDAIEQYKSSSTDDPPPFYSKEQLWLEDPYTLLYLVIRTFLPESQMDCNLHLKQNRSLLSALQTAYTSHDFASLLSHDAMPDDVKERAPKLEQDITPSTSGSLQDLQDSRALNFPLLFKAPYIGDMARLLIETLNEEREAYLKNRLANKPYNWTVSVVQSSGMGKSRMAEEAGKTVFTFPINIRQETETDRKAYPPPDSAIRRFFEERVNSNDETQQADYMLLLREMFIRALDLVNARFPGLTGADLARAWANYLAEGETNLKPGHHRQQFYDEVVSEATAKISRKAKLELDELERSLQTSCKRLIKRIQPISDGTNACFVYIDEAHSLTQAIKGGNKDHERNQFHNLGKVLSKLVNYPMFFIFLSTNPSLKGLAPPASYHRSDRAVQGSRLIPPFTELPFDIYEDEVIDEFGSMTLARACEVDVMVLFGRPLWYTIHKADSDVDVFQLAMSKLSNDRMSGHESDSILAALGVRVGIAFEGKEIIFDEEPNRIAANEGKTAIEAQHPYWTQSRLVESHMRVAYSIPQHRGYMHTGAPSEPVLAEAAGQYLSSGNLGGIMIEGPKRLCEALETGLLASGERRELVARLLVTAARDIALGPLRQMCNRPLYHRPIRVMDFLQGLFHKDHHAEIRDAKSLTRRVGIKSLGEAFHNSFVSFSHFALAGDSEMLSAPALAIALLRGMAIQAKAGQESIDAVIPIHMGSLDDPVSAKTTSAINLQVKNRQGLSHCKIDRSITVPDAKMPVISITLELGVTGEKSNTVEIVRESFKKSRRKLHPDDHHYQIIVRGCSSKLFRPVTGEVEMQYQVMLGQGSVLEDFARCDTTDNVEAMQAMKPAMDGKQQVQRYGEAKPKEESTSQEALQAVKPVADGKQKKSVRFSDLVT
ncbi:putative G2/mitotic-specific cyclin cdc13 [Rhizoctonia solani 123E]|uniref:Putative G2/mitotic-specific cyclin cdc13 n=1 Tax=Rhizoctonia solani 123E TaxID=1423351 RepID=A0A074S720_9AGAM|nr:putative G2/mitotic-specific cyclin cdc13 [Rhizoctonia solani 123E]